jgi:hypothetical protein
MDSRSSPAEWTARDREPLIFAVMHHNTNPMAQAWLDAAGDLGIRVQHPFSFSTASGVTATTQGVFLPDFGGPSGTLVTCRFDADGVEALADQTPYYRSTLNPGSYEPYSRELYIDTLNDWGWFGAASRQPNWFTASPWTDKPA